MSGQISCQNEYTEAIKAIKAAILQSRYTAARLVNREMLKLYFSVGAYISANTRQGKWGTSAIENISRQLQNELPGLRGFSASNMKYMRQFFEEWNALLQIRQSPIGEFENRQPITADFVPTNRQLIIGDLQITDNKYFNDEMADAFFDVGFTHHIQIFSKCKDLDERLFYIRRCAAEFWSVEKLKYYLNENLYSKQTATNNFSTTIANADYRKRAMQSFKDEYLLDFINIEDPDETDEREIESQIVQNIKKFIMALGSDFSFLGNQYRLIVDEKEYFIDLLFFNRRLQSLIAIELKRGEFKPEYAGKLNFYLSALDEYVKLPHEKPSIGIVLCKSRSRKIVEFAFRDTSKPMGVATYKTANELPAEYKGILPNAEELKTLL